MNDPFLAELEGGRAVVERAALDVRADAQAPRSVSGSEVAAGPLPVVSPAAAVGVSPADPAATADGGGAASGAGECGGAITAAPGAEVASSPVGTGPAATPPTAGNTPVEGGTAGSAEARATTTAGAASPGGIAIEDLLGGARHEGVADACAVELERKCDMTGVSLYRKKIDPAYATCVAFDQSTRVAMNMKSDLFTTWLARKTGISRGSKAFSRTRKCMEDIAVHGGVEYEPSRYWARKGPHVYLSNGPGRIVRIGPGTVEKVDNGTDGVLFLGQFLRPWRLVDRRETVDPFAECSVWNGMQASHLERLSFKLWATLIPTCPNCKPQLLLHGTSGSGKTSAIKPVAQLYGFEPRIVHPGAGSKRDLWVSLDSGGLVVLDNVDDPVRWLADTLAVAATDGTAENRQVYTNSGICRHRAHAWICITSCDPAFASDPGSADRLTSVKLGPRARNLGEADMAAEVENVRDRGLSRIAWDLADMLADPAEVPNTTALNARFPGFARDAVKLGRVWGRENEVIAALRWAEQQKSVMCLDSDEAGSAITKYVETNGVIEGRATEILRALQVDEPDLHRSEWNAKKLGKRISLLMPLLQRRFDMRVEESRQRGNRYVILRRPSPVGNGVAPMEGAA